MAAIGRSQSVNPQRVLIARLEVAAKAAVAARDALQEANEAASKLLKDIESQRAKIPASDASSAESIEEKGDALRQRVFTRLSDLRARHDRLIAENKKLDAELNKYPARFQHLKQASFYLWQEVCYIMSSENYHMLDRMKHSITTL